MRMVMTMCLLLIVHDHSGASLQWVPMYYCTSYRDNRFYCNWGSQSMVGHAQLDRLPDVLVVESRLQLL